MKCSKCENEAVGIFPEKEILTEYKIERRGINKRIVSFLYPEGAAYCREHMEEIRKEVLKVFTP